MWLVGTKQNPTAYWLSERCVARRIGGIPLEVVTVSSVEEGLSHLNSWLNTRGARGGRLWLGGALCRLIAVPAAKGVAGLVEAETVAKLELQTHTDESANFDFKLHECDPALVVWRATLTERKLVGDSAAAWRRHLKSIKPWWSSSRIPPAVHQSGLAQNVLAYDGEALTEWRRESTGQITLARTQSVAGGYEAFHRQLLRRRAVAGADETVTAFALNMQGEKHAEDLNAGEEEYFPFTPWTEVLR